MNHAKTKPSTDKQTGAHHRSCRNRGHRGLRFGTVFGADLFSALLQAKVVGTVGLYQSDLI